MNPEAHFDAEHERLHRPYARGLAAVFKIIPEARVNVETELLGNHELQSDTQVNRELDTLHGFLVQILFRFCRHEIPVGDAFLHGSSGVCIEIDEIALQDIEIGIDRNPDVVLSVPYVG